MVVQVQFRRGNTSQHSTFTGAEGELSVNTEKDIIIVHDGVTVGGHEVARVNNPYFNGSITANGYINVGNSTVNTTVNATSFTGDSATVGGNTISAINTYANNKAANAYSNATSYADGLIIDSVTNTSIVYAASANSVKNSYDRAIDANTRAGSAQTEASAAYSNATSYADNKAANAYSNATSYADNKAANAYSNAVSYADGRIIDSVTNTSIAYAASANSVKNAYDRAIDANTRANSAQTEAASAYSNAVSYITTANFTRTGVTTFSANIILGSSGLSSNGSFGTSGQVLSSNGTAVYWATAGGGGSVTVSATAPISPSAGDLWYDSTNGSTLIYYSDGSSTQWVESMQSQLSNNFSIPDMNGGSASTTSWTYSIKCGAAT
jgi:hypothetical protein